MQSDSSDNANLRLRKPFAGVRALVCSYACVVLALPIAIGMARIVIYFLPPEIEGIGIAWGVILHTWLTMIALGLLFLVWASIIGGKFTRLLCKISALLALAIIFGAFVVANW
jgi:hypothetical protein